MKGSWFRMYDSVLDDPKVQRLPAETFRRWVNLLCLAKRHNGVLPPIEDIAFALRIADAAAAKLVKTLTEAELLDDTETGAVPHNWQRRQYKSDDSNERVKRYRARQRNGDDTVTSSVTEPVTETPPEYRVQKQKTETDSEPIGSADDAPLKERIFGTLCAWLVEKTGRSRRSVASFLGRCIKEAGEAETLHAGLAAQKASAPDPLAYMRGALKAASGNGQDFSMTEVLKEIEDEQRTGSRDHHEADDDPVCKTAAN